MIFFFSLMSDVMRVYLYEYDMVVSMGGCCGR